VKPINLTVKTKKFQFSKDANFSEYGKLVRRVKKEFKADECYLHSNGKIVVHHVKVVGTWKSKRIDGVVV